MLDPALFASFSNAEKFDHAPCRCSSTSSTASTIPGVTTALVPGSTTHRNGFDTARLWVKPCRDRKASTRAAGLPTGPALRIDTPVTAVRIVQTLSVSFATRYRVWG
jgi:hypothetical protein